MTHAWGFRPYLQVKEVRVLNDTLMPLTAGTSQDTCAKEKAATVTWEQNTERRSHHGTTGTIEN